MVAVWCAAWLDAGVCWSFGASVVSVGPVDGAAVVLVVGNVIFCWLLVTFVAAAVETVGVPACWPALAGVFGAGSVGVESSLVSWAAVIFTGLGTG